MLKTFGKMPLSNNGEFCRLRWPKVLTRNEGMNFVPYFDDQINIQTQAIFLFKIWLMVLVIAGLLVILLSIFLGRVFPSLSSDLIKLGGIFVAVLAVFPGDGGHR